MIKVVSFDVDGTLVDPSFADLVWLEGIPHLYAEKHNTDFESAKKVVTEAYDHIGEDNIKWYMLDYWFTHFDLDGSYHDLLDKYRKRITVYEEVPDVLDRLSKKYVLIVASNAHRDFLSLTLSSIESYFDYIFSATADFGQVRKYEIFYHEIMKKLQVSPDEMAHVGDHYRFDYEVPLKAGIHAYFLDRKGGKGLKTLREFEEKLNQIAR